MVLSSSSHKTKRSNQVIKGGKERRQVSEDIFFEKDGSVGVVTINRPKANQLSHGVLEGLEATLDACKADSRMRVLIITNSGEKIFCAGADLSSGFGQLTLLDYLKRGQDLNNAIESMPIPVIAAMNGHAFGGGLEMAMACHFRLLKNDSRVGLTETNLGIMPGYGGTLRLPRLVGSARALEFMLLGKQIEADEALAAGLVHRICEDGAVFGDALQLAKQLATRPPLAVRQILKVLAQKANFSPEQHLKVERESLAELLKSKDMIEGMTAFAQKRQPVFKGE
jgi:enoyl-CoA hydratase/carnithine racemase